MHLGFRLAPLLVLAGCDPGVKNGFQIRVEQYPETITANQPAELMDLEIEDSYQPVFPVRVQFRTNPDCASEDWFDCGTTEVDGVVRETTISEEDAVDGTAITTEFLVCNIKGAKAGTTVLVYAVVCMVDADDVESNCVDVSYTCVVE